MHIAIRSRLNANCAHSKILPALYPSASTPTGIESTKRKLNDDIHPRPLTIYAALLLAIVAIASASMAIRLCQGIDPLLIAAIRVTCTGTALAILRPRACIGLFYQSLRSPRTGLWMGAAAFTLAAHFWAWIASLSYTSVLRSTALVSTQPIFAVLIGALSGEKIHGRTWLANAIAIVGVLLFASPDALGYDVQELLEWRSGDAMALAGAFFVALYLTIGRGLRHQVDLFAYLAFINLLAGMMLAILYAWTTSPLIALERVQTISAQHWCYLIYLGLVPGILGHGIINWAVRKLPVRNVSLVILLEPLGAGALALLFLHELPRAQDWIATLIVLLGVAIGIKEPKSSLTPKQSA